jgi:proteasome accessory factor B
MTWDDRDDRQFDDPTVDEVGGDRAEAKRDRLARLLSVLGVLQGSGEAGIRPDEIARRTGMSKRTVYRDLRALESELRLPVWSEGGRWGVQPGAFLPPLRLTLPEAMAIFLSARLVTRYADKYEPHLASAFQKLEEGLPDALREHVERTLDDLSRRRVDEAFNRHVEDLTRAWADRRVVRFRYAPARYDGTEREPRWAEVRPYLLEPSLATHALYLIGHDETRDALRTFKVERILDLSLTLRTFDAPDAGVLAATLRRAWDIIADQPETQVVLRFDPSVGARVREATWHPSQEVRETEDGSLEWRARVSGTIEIRLWILSWGDEVEVLEPIELRADVARTLARAIARYG